MKIDHKMLTKAKQELDQESAMLVDFFKAECGPVGLLAMMTVLKERLTRGVEKQDLLEVLLSRLAAHGMSQVMASLCDRAAEEEGGK